MSPSQSLVVLLSLISVTSAFFVLKFGKCPRPPLKQDFDITRYLRRWWEYQRFPAPFEFASTCGFANYTLIASNKIKVLNSGIQKINFLFFNYCKRIDATGEAVIVDPAKPTQLKVVFGKMPSPEKPNYFVVDTDYDNFAVVFSCSDYVLFNVQFAWILTRAQGVPPTNLKDIHNTLRNSGIDIRPFITVDQRDC